MSPVWELIWCCCHKLRSAFFGSAGRCICGKHVPKHVLPIEFAECPLVDRLGNIITYNMVKESFSCIFTFLDLNLSVIIRAGTIWVAILATFANS